MPFAWVWAFNIIIMHMRDELASMTNGLCALARNESQLLSNGRCHNNRINYLILITGVNPSRPPPPLLLVMAPSLLTLH